MLLTGLAKKKGVGSALVSEMMRAFERLGVDSVACVAWQYHDPKHGEVENIKGIMDAFGFERFASIADYWADELDSFICPKCITPPCRCQATIYFKSLKDA